MRTFEPGIWTGCVNDFSADHGQNRFDAFELVQRHRHVILRQNREVGEFPGSSEPRLSSSNENHALPIV